MPSSVDHLAAYRTDGYRRRDGSEGPVYQVPDVVYRSPSIRKIRVICIGAGISGIMNSYNIQKHTENVEHVVYEKNADIGGTWLVNRYPGCGCDVPSHAYTYPFALNPDWPRLFSYSADIWEYLNRICDVFKLRSHMKFNTEVVGCYWQEATKQWLVKLRQQLPDGSIREFDDTCHILLHCTGVLNHFQWPQIDGLERFKGKVIHTARWPDDYQKEQWANERVAVIGSGASSIQTVPGMQPYVKHIDVFVRTAVWFVQLTEDFSANHEYSNEEKTRFREDVAELVDHAKGLEDRFSGMWNMFLSESKAQADAQDLFRNRMAGHIKDKRLLDGFSPKWGVGCRRVTPGDPYMQAIQKDNVSVHFTAASKVTEEGVVGEDGVERVVDTIICATGFDVSYQPRFPIVGQDGIDLAQKWKSCPESYLGLGAPGFPNFITFIGPTWPIHNGSVMGPLHSVSLYALQMIQKLQTEYIGSLSPKQQATDAFNAHVQEWIKHTVWKQDCRSWYKDNETGRVNAIWPGSSLHYIEVISTPRYEDFDIEYIDAGVNNMWAFLGMGATRRLVEKGDVSPYIGVGSIDPEWALATGLGVTLNKEINGLEKESLCEGTPQIATVTRA